MKILVTGFEPWGDLTSNPSGDLARSLEGERIGGAEIVTAVLPVEYGEDTKIVFPLMETHKPVAVVSFGLGISPCLNVERVAVNLKNDGSAIDGDGPDAYFATLPTEAIRNAIVEGGIPAQLSYHAGRFLCNHIMYSVLHHTRQSLPSGFIHLPPTPDLAASERGNGHSMSLDTMRIGAVLALENLVDFLNRKDAHA